MKQHARRAAPSDEIYRNLMAELTGEDPDNYRNRPFDMELLDYAPSAPEGTSRLFGAPLMPHRAE